MKTLSKSATGAEQLSSSELIPDSRPIAGQGVKNEGEPSDASQIPSGGTGMNRRSIMNMFVGAALTGTALSDAARSASAGEAALPDDPIFSLIENHRTAAANYAAAIADLPAGSLSPDPVKEDYYGRLERTACHSLVGTTPTTLQGLLTLVSYVEGVSQSGDNAFDDDVYDVVASVRECLSQHLPPIVSAQITELVESSASARPHRSASPVSPDAELVELGREFVELARHADALNAETSRLCDIACLSYPPGTVYEAARRGPAAEKAYTAAVNEADEAAGVAAAEAAFEDAMDRLRAMFARIIAMRPTTVEGMRAVCLAALHFEGDGTVEYGEGAIGGAGFAVLAAGLLDKPLPKLPDWAAAWI